MTFDVRVPEHLPVLATRDDLDELLGNVVDNACTWARSRCRIDARVVDARVIITIDDDGPGMPVELRARVPSRGVRADEAIAGSGLGLSISSDLAQAYGGRLALGDSLLGGLRVEIELPAG